MGYYDVQSSLTCVNCTRRQIRCVPTVSRVHARRSEFWLILVTVCSLQFVLEASQSHNHLDNRRATAYLTNSYLEPRRIVRGPRPACPNLITRPKITNFDWRNLIYRLACITVPVVCIFVMAAGEVGGVSY